MGKKKTFSFEQNIAANPAENIWVQANAGTGKTTVLVERLLRILFRTPSLGDTGILCLTFTNAGAGEMRNRILVALRKWATADDDQLADLLNGVTLNTIPLPDDLARARNIFYKYIDNPDLLKIKTIHGFCEEILRRFPLEAGLSPAWRLVSDYSQRVLLQDAFLKLVTTQSQDVVVMNAFEHIVNNMSERNFDELLGVLSNRYKDFFLVENIVNYKEYFIDTAKYFLLSGFEKNTDADIKVLQKMVQNATNLQIKRKTPAKYLEKIIRLTQQYIDKTIDFEKYKTAYLTTKGTPIDDVQKSGCFAEEQARVYRLNQRNQNKKIYDDTLALFVLSATFADVYRQMKLRQNLLDFEDLILYTRRLFLKTDVMGWVLSQLNVSIGYILVDEAQDTSPIQWDILRMLAGDFFTDGDTSDAPHTMFIVGDTKQSIFSFQGADPRAFAASRQAISCQITQNMRTMRDVPLAQSFRSTPAILNTVDEFFSDPDVVALTGFVNNTHKCLRTDSGLVELHRLITRNDMDKIRYIQNIADKIQSIINGGKYRANDIMVLVKKREPFAPLLVKELKSRGIDVAGSDRIVLPNFPAIRDLMNLVRFCTDTTDDYSLCCVLKSPLYRLSERDIFKICNIKNVKGFKQKKDIPDAKTITVFDVLQTEYLAIYSDLKNIISWANELGPYSFFSNVLNHNSVRQSMIAALGNQIIDPLEEFMTICLSYERTQAGTLRHFLKWFITGASEIKRDMDAAGGVRIVTVHGSKGLEASVVFLIDTVFKSGTDRICPIPKNDLSPSLRQKYDSFPMPWMWVVHANNSQKLADATALAVKDKNAEYYRLLYVAMTRARDRLYIYGYTQNTQAPLISWHTQLWNVLSRNHSDKMTNNNIIRVTND